MTLHPSTRPSRIDPAAETGEQTLGTPAVVYPITRSKVADLAPAGTSETVELWIVLASDHTRLELRNPTGGQRCVLDRLEGAPAVLRSGNGWLHIDAPGVLSCSIVDAETPNEALVYARTPVLGDLGIAGGRFDPPTLRRTTDSD